MSTAAFLEDQDFFRFFGIFRNVTLKAIPDIHLEDVWFHPVLNQDNTSGEISVSVKVSAKGERGITARFILQNQNGDDVLAKYIPLLEENGMYTGQISAELENVKVWDNHTPYLYRAYVELKDEMETLYEVIPYEIGFRRLEVIDKVMYLKWKTSCPYRCQSS